MIAAMAFLRRLKLSHYAIIALVAACLVLKLSLAAEQRRSAKLETQLVKVVALRKADHAAYRAAQIEAAARNKAKVEQIETASQEITNDISQDYASDLARLRAQLVRDKGQADKRVAGRAGSGQTGTPAPGVDGDGVPLRPADDLQAAEIELRLMHLQDWVERQVAVAR